MAYQTLGNGTAVAKAPMKATTTKRFTSKVRLHVVPKSGQMVNIKTVTHNALLGMRNNDPSISFMDTKGNSISLNAFSSYASATFNDAFGLVTRAGRSPEIIVGLEFESALCRRLSNISKSGSSRTPLSSVISTSFKPLL